MSYLTEERKMIQQTARDFAMNEVLPVANKLDPVEGEIPMELRNKMGELGYFGIMIPEEYGGLGLGSFEYALVAEELARAWMSVGSIIARGNGIYGDDAVAFAGCADVLSGRAAAAGVLPVELSDAAVSS